MKKVLFFLLAFTSSAFGQYTQMQWGMNKTVTPYTYGLNMSGVWYDFATVALWQWPAPSTRKIFTIATPNYQAANWGISPTSADNAAAFNQAIEDISYFGGGTLELPAGEFTTGTVTLRDNVYIKGGGQNNTTIKLKTGTNSDLFYTLNAYALFGTNSTGGVTNFGLTDLTLDGNRSNNTAGNCFTAYGYKYLLENLVIKNCPDSGIRTEWAQYGDFGMESYFHNLLIDTTGEHGIKTDGPHDSEYNLVMIIDASQKVNAGWDALYVGPYGNGRFYNFHGWHRSTTSNRARYQAYINTTGANFTGSHFEGSRLAAIALSDIAIRNSFDSTNMYYSTWNPGQPTVIVSGKDNIIQGTIIGSDSGTAVKGIELYDNGNPIIGKPSGNTINLTVMKTSLGVIDFSGSGGYNVININGSQDTGPGYIGSPNPLDTVNLQIYDATSPVYLHVNTSPLTEFRKDQDAPTIVRINNNNNNSANAMSRLELVVKNSGAGCWSTLLNNTGSPYYNFSCDAAVGYSVWDVKHFFNNETNFNFATYFNAALNVKGSGAGYTNLVSANTTGTNYSATLPANTGDIAETNLAQTFSARQTFNSGIGIVNLAVSGSAPTISSGFGTAPSITASNGTAAFRLNVGTGGTATSGVIGLPTATNGWNCFASDITTPATGHAIKQSAGTTTSATLTNYNNAGVATAWAASDILIVNCTAY